MKGNFVLDLNFAIIITMPFKKNRKAINNQK